MIKTYLNLQRFSHKGEILEEKRLESRSWLRHFIEILYNLTACVVININDVNSVARDVKITFTDVGVAQGTLIVGSPPGNVQALFPASQSLFCKFNSVTPTVGQDVGIVVGTGNNPVTPTQDALQTLIAHGEGAGQFLYGGTEIFGLTIADPNGQFTIRRLLENISGGGITVEEVGIYTVGNNNDNYNYRYCIARDLTGGIAVAHTELLQVTYAVLITV